MKRYKFFLLLADLLSIFFCLLFSLLLRFGTDVPSHFTLYFTQTIPIICCIFLLTFLISGLYKSLWKYASLQEILQIGIAIPLGTLLILAYGILSHQLFPNSVYFINMFLLTFGTIGIRLSYRFFRRVKYIYLDYKTNKTHQELPNVMIVGAGEAGLMILKEYQQTKLSGHVCLFVDDNPLKQHCLLQGILVAGPCKSIPSLIKKYDIKQVILAIPSASKKRIAEILELCHSSSCKIMIFPGIGNSLNSESSLMRLRPVQIEDLLGRDEIILDNTRLTDCIENQVVLVTGGGGSIGSELCRQISMLNPKKLIIFDIYENNAYDLQNELLQNGFPSNKLEVVIGSVRDTIRVQHIFALYHPDIVFHAAAHKHVPLMEDNPTEAIKNNIFGTYHVAKCAVEHHIKKFILISTDKAVNPTNVMGASKRFCEMIIQAMSNTSNFTEFAAVRFGNVLGSNGSVIPLFKHQIEAGGPVTITHPDIIRYFMTIPEAVRLILQAMSFAHGGEIFVLDMGKPVKILDLAQNLIRLSGLQVGEDIEIKFTGLRPGEKLYEELLMGQKDLRSTDCDKIFIEKPLIMDYKTIINELYYLEEILATDGDIKEALQKIVPTYHPAPPVKPLPETKSSTTPEFLPSKDVIPSKTGYAI